jgi:Membrane bound O-acyl transferase family
MNTTMKAMLPDGRAVSRELLPPIKATQRAEFTSNWIAWAPAVLLPVAAFSIRNALPPWLFMWLFAIAIFLGLKWQTWWMARSHGDDRGLKQSLAYLFLWPGMDARQFFETDSEGGRVAPREWIASVTKTLAGATLIFVAARALLDHPLLAGWTGMIGIVLFLHFGTFHLIALAWQRAGVHAQPIMEKPLASESLAELWGRRWNLGFRKLSHSLVFRPLQKRFGTAAGTLGAFFASGLIHDLVISVPARGGYGLPTLYFLLQGLGVLVERSRVGNYLGLTHGLSGRLWTALVAVGPLPLLFHPWFIVRVIIPFLHAVAG